MEFIAECFDAPPDSEKHRSIRETAWMGGDLVEGRYLLGMLIGENLFKVANEDYAGRLRDFVSRDVSVSVADIFCDLHECSHLIPFLRYHYHQQAGFAPLPSRNGHIETAVYHLLHDLDASDSEIAAKLGITEKQVQRISDLKALRKVIRVHRESASR